MSDHDTLNVYFAADFADAKPLPGGFADLFVSPNQYDLAERQLFQAWADLDNWPNGLLDLPARTTIFDLARDHRMGDDS